VAKAKKMLDQEPWVVLSVGAMFGGSGIPETVRKGIQSLAQYVKRAREALPPFTEANAAGVNVVFHVPGDILQPDFKGMRTGSWFGKRRTQVVQVAVPSDLRDPHDVADFLAESVEQAVREAAYRMSRFRRSSDLTTSQAVAAATAAAAALRAANQH
jgi:hypothetical protein